MISDLGWAGGIIFITVLLIYGIVKTHEADEAKWAKFSAAHECKVVSRMQGDTLVSPIISSKGGVAVTSIPAKTAYLCNDGITYWRDSQ